LKFHAWHHWFYSFSIKKIGRKYNQKKIKHLKKFVKMFAIWIYPPF
jgi:hypothetical protein